MTWWRRTRRGLILCSVALAMLAQGCISPPTPPSPTVAASPVAEVIPPTATATTERLPTATTLPATATSSPSPTSTPTATATATPIPTSTPTATPVIHLVEEGDLLGRIAQQYAISLDELVEANDIDPDDVLSIGQELVIPVPTATPDPAEPTAPTTPTAPPTATPSPSPTPEPLVHVVERGDLLGRLAQQYGVSVDELAAANGIDPEDVLSIGQELVIPGQVGSASESPTTATPTSSPTVTSTSTPTSTATRTVTPTATTAPARATASATPTPSPTGEPTATPEPTQLADLYHTVEQGEYLGAIARRYGIDEALIARANGITSETILRIGQQLLIPDVPVTPTNTPRPTQASPTDAAEPAETPRADVIHIVEQGEYLGVIATRYDVAVADIAQANDISVNAVLSVGQELVIPSIPVTPTATHTPTATLTLTPTPTATPTLMRSNQVLPFRAPFLLGPRQGASYQSADARILLNWTSVGILGPNEWYLVRVWPTGRPEDGIEAWTKATSWRPDGTPLPESWNRLLRLSWDVTVVERLQGTPPWRVASPASVTRGFTWDLRTPTP